MERGGFSLFTLNASVMGGHVDLAFWVVRWEMGLLSVGFLSVVYLGYSRYGSYGAGGLLLVCE